MPIGFGGPTLFLLWMVSLVASLLWRQRFSPYVLAVGMALLAIWMGCLFFRSFAPFIWIGLNLYVALMVAILLIVAGLIGMVVMGGRMIFYRLSGNSRTAR